MGRRKSVNAHKQFIHILITPNTEDEWFLTVVYASPKPAVKANLWKELEEPHISAPWCIIGDFNLVLRCDE